MRGKLANIKDVRSAFKGVFVRYGTKNGWQGDIETTVLLTDIKDLEGNYITDHLWFNCTKGFEKLGELEEGDLIQFDARSKSYTKGYRGRDWEIRSEKPVSTDYKLSHPTKIKKLN